MMRQIGKKFIFTRIFIFLILGLWVTGCGYHSEVREKLLAAERLMDGHPDSAYAVLQTIDTLRIKSDEDRALYGLLLTMAQDKNHLDPTDDKPISFAADYFNKKKDLPREIKSNYYRGRVQFLNGSYPDALVSFFKAKELAEKTPGQIFWAGMAARGISDTYNATLNYADELEFAKLELKYLQEAGIQPYINYALLDLAHAYNNTRNTDLIEPICLQLIDSAFIYNDPYLDYCAKSLLSGHLMWEGEFQKSISLFNDIFDSGYADVLDSIYYAWNLIENGQPEKGRLILQEKESSKLPMLYHVGYILNRKEGNSDEALNRIELLNSRLNVSDSYNLKYDLANVVSSFYETNAKLQNEEIRNNRFNLLFALFIASIILLFIIVPAYILNFLYKRDNERKLKFALELKSALEQKTHNDSAMDSLFLNLFESKYDMVSKIGDLVQYGKESKVVRSLLLSKIGEVIKDFSISGSKLKQIEIQVNKVYKNLYDDFKNDLPDLKNSYHVLFLYSILGFSNNAMACLLNESSVEAVYNRKRHLKDKIKALEKSKCNRYLTFIR